MRTLPRALSDAAAGSGGFWHLDERGEGRFTAHAELGEAAAAAAGGLASAGLKPPDTIAIAVASTQDFVTAFFAATYAGCVVSPLPAASVIRDPDGYRAHVRPLLDVARPAALIADERSRAALAADLAARGVRVVAAESLPAGPPLVHAASAGEVALMQLTSGSTGQPRGVVLPHEAIAANVIGISRALAIDGRLDIGVSWLPLHHDMGLVGVLLATVAAGARTALLPPLAFVKRPGLWLRVLSDYRGTVSFAPSSAYALAARRLRPADLEHLDLGAWRVAGCGAEPIDAAALEQFAAVTAPCGFRRSAFVPSYGLAEHVVAAAMTDPGRGVTIDRVDARRLAAQHVAAPTDRADAAVRHVVSCGRPLDGHAIRILGRDGRAVPDRTVGEIELRGPSVMRGYRGLDGGLESPPGGALKTGDLGYLAGGELFVCGRLKETIVRSGAKFHPHDIERAAAGLGALRGASIAAFGTTPGAGEERVIVTVEATSNDVSLPGAVRAAVLAHCNVRVDEVLVVRPRTIPRTTSGKPQRLALRDRYERGDLTREARLRG